MFVIKSCSVRLSLLLLHCLSWEVKAFGPKSLSQRIVHMPRNDIPQVGRFRMLGTAPGPEEVSSKSDTESGKWNLKALRNEIARRQLRTLKKVENANRWLASLDSSTEEKEEQPETTKYASDIIKAREGLMVQQELLHSLNTLNEDILAVKTTKDPQFIDLLPEITRLGFSEQAATPKGTTPAKKQTKTTPPSRLPYHVYDSIDGIEIRVGRGAADNDLLSCRPAHRDGANWWMHVSGYPGSHVVIRSTDDNLPTTRRQTVLDAAVLTAVHSKASAGGRVQVSLTRCRDVSKPRGAKPGLVQLTGEIHTITVDVKAESKRLARLKRVDASTATD